MRLLLDAQLSGNVIGHRLRQQGHDVVALTDHPELEGIDDSEVLALATADNRIVITHNVKDFPDILRDWAEEGRTHAGCIVLVGIRLNEFGVLMRAIEAALKAQSDQREWINGSVMVGRR